MKRDKIFRRDDLRDYLTKLNPLGLRDETGMLGVFTSTYACYCEFVKRLWTMCPRGYIDPEIILCEWYSLTLHDAENEVISWKKRFNHTLGPILVEWRKEKETIIILRMLIMAVSELLEVSYKEDQFVLAMEDFFNVRRDLFQYKL